MKLKEILQDDSLQNIKLAAGVDGLYREVTQISIIDTPDMLDILYAGQLLVTAGFYFHENQNILKQLVVHMHKIHGAGIVIKHSANLKVLSQDVTQLANKLNMPILWSPEHKELSLTVKQFTQAMCTIQNFELKQIIVINQQLSELNTKNITYQHLLDQSAKILNTPLVLLDSHFRARYASNQWLTQRDSLTHFLRHESHIDYLNLTKPTQIRLYKDTIDILPIFSALNENKAFAAFIVNQSDSSDFQILKRQQVVNTLGLANSRTDLLNETAFRNRSEFFLNVMQNSLSPSAISHYLQDTHINDKQDYHVAIIEFVQKNTTIESRQFEIRQQLTRWYITEYQSPVLIFSYQQQLVLLVAEEINISVFLQALTLFLNQQKSLHHKFTIGFSKLAETIYSLSDLYEQANHALQLTSSAHPLMVFRPKNAQDLLNLLPKTETHAFIEKTLGGILSNPELLNTLKTYIILHQNVTAVSLNLFVHRNTVTYRLKRISVLLDVNLEMPDVLADIQLAFLLL